MKHIFSASIAALILTVPNAWGQAFNINFGVPGSPFPPITYAAASGQAGTWTTLNASAVVNDIGGIGTPVEVQWNSVGIISGGSCSTTADSLLLNQATQIAVPLEQGGVGKMAIRNLALGDYYIYTYSQPPIVPNALVDISVPGSFSPMQTVGGTTCIDLAQAPQLETHAIHLVTVVDNAPVVVEFRRNTDSPYISGIQIVPTTGWGTAFCFGDGSGGVNCPCLNPGSNGAGCANSVAASGASLVGTGVPSVTSTLPNQFTLNVSNSTPSQPGLFFQGLNQPGGGSGVTFGDGIRCTGGGIIRLGVVTTNSAGNATSNMLISSVGGVAAGVTRHYQYWYRDPNTPCGAYFNLTNGWSTTWQL